MSRELVDQYWDDGYAVFTYRDDDGYLIDEREPMSEYEFLHGEPDPDDTGEYYTEWMPKYGGRQPDDDD